MHKFYLFLFLLLIVTHTSPAQVRYCPDTTQSPYICETVAWNWEVTLSDSNYCDMWYGKLNSFPYLARLGSPFVVPSSGNLYQISIAQDYTRAKGWELITRDFGCLQNISNPYFILYHRSRGLVRIYLYGGLQKAYSYFLATLVPASDPQENSYSWMGDLELITYDSEELKQRASAESIGLASSESSGLANWTVLEADVTNYPALKKGVETGRGISIRMYGIVLYSFASEPKPEQSTVYPNPATNAITLRTDKGLSETATVSLVTLTGQVVASYPLSGIKRQRPIDWRDLRTTYTAIDWNKALYTEYTIPVASLAAGFYVLRYISDQGSFARKVVISEH